MISAEAAKTDDSKLTIDNFLSKLENKTVIKDITEGLTSPKKYISCVYLYDTAGSQLFEKITTLPEYYPARTEKKLLNRISSLICNILRNIDIVELGSGDCSKISILLKAVAPVSLQTLRYIPVDVSPFAVESSSLILSSTFPEISIHGIIADFLKQLHLIPNKRQRFFCFLGSTIGNLSKTNAAEFLKNLRQNMSDGDTLLLGADMVKSEDLLHKAYNDSDGVTAQFNLNILKVINNIAGTDFQPELFEHEAFFNDDFSRVEMQLKAKEDMEVNSPLIDDSIFIKKGETIHTENSHKFTPNDLEELASAANLQIQKTFTDENQWYSLVLLQKNKES